MPVEVDGGILRARHHVHRRDELRLRAIIENGRRRKLGRHAAAGTDRGGTRRALLARLDRRGGAASTTATTATLRGGRQGHGYGQKREESDRRTTAHGGSGGTWNKVSLTRAQRRGTEPVRRGEPKICRGAKGHGRRVAPQLPVRNW